VLSEFSERVWVNVLDVVGVCEHARWMVLVLVELSDHLASGSEIEEFVSIGLLDLSGSFGAVTFFGQNALKFGFKGSEEDMVILFLFSESCTA
jgi:hypothetical protein